MKKTQFIGLALALTLLSLTWIFLTPLLFVEADADITSSAPHPGFIAPGFSLETPQGTVKSLADYEGQPVLVFFWASWCSVCKRVMPGLEDVYQDFAPLGFEILAINTTFQDTLQAALNTFQSQGYTYTLLLDRDGGVAADYRMQAVPTSVLIGPDGIVTDVIIGAGISEGFLRAQLDDYFRDGGE